MKWIVISEFTTDKGTMNSYEEAFIDVAEALAFYDMQVERYEELKKLAKWKYAKVVLKLEHKAMYKLI